MEILNIWDAKMHGWKKGWREIGNTRHFYRSRSEANYARFLEWQKSRGIIKDWAYEPETFWFNGVKRGVVSYLPDFKVTFQDGKQEYHEIKGWMDLKSKTKLKRMAKFYPSVVVKLISHKAYKDLEQMVFRMVSGWEE